MVSAWPDLERLPLSPTLKTLHLWTQVIGKVRLMLTPWENHAWHVPFYLSPRGFITGLMAQPGLAVQAEFDLLAEVLILRTTAGDDSSLPLGPGRLSDFYDTALAAFRTAGIEVAIDPMPNELPDGVRFDRDHEMRGFDAAVARQYWRALLEMHRVFQLFRTRFMGKISPIHLFWGAFDLAVTRFSGREAPPHPGGAPFLNDAVAREAYSREVSSAGFWPNLDSSEGPCFYSYAYPMPGGYAAHPVRPAMARFDAALGEFVLPYAAVRASADPDQTLLDFLQTTYEAAADLAGWDRQRLDRDQGLLGKPPVGS